MSVAGKFSTMSMADLIQWTRTAQRTGLLRLSDGHNKEISVIFHDGHIVFSSTNEKRERWRGYLVHLGLCDDSEFEEAFRIAEASGASAASVLVRNGKVTREQALETLAEKTFEDVCDAFLWPDGAFSFEPRQPPARSSLTIDIDPINVVCEGLRRTEIWSRMTAFITPSSLYEQTGGQLDDADAWEDGRTARQILPYLDGSVTVGELIDRLPFSRFKVHRAVSELLDRHLIRGCDTTAVVDREKRIQQKVGDAHRAAEAGRWTEAMAILNGLSGANPGRTDLVKELLGVMRGFEQSIYAHNFTPEDVPVVAIGPDALQRVNIDPTEAFLLSRVDGRLTIRAILRISPVSEFDGLRCFKRLQSAKVIDFPYRKAAASEATPVTG